MMKKEEIDDFYKLLLVTIDKMEATVNGLEERMKKIVKTNLNKLENVELKTSLMLRKLSNKVNAISRGEAEIKEALVGQINAFNGIEDTFFTLYHNIKRNQFLYADSCEKAPWNDYHDIKKFYKEQLKEGDVV